MPFNTRTLIKEYKKSLRELNHLKQKYNSKKGRTEKVIIHHLTVVDGVDQDVVAALENKTGTQDQLMDALKARIKKIKSGVGA